MSVAISRSDASREARLRREATRQGVALRKSRRARHGTAGWFVVDPSRNSLLSSEHGMTLDEVEAWLAE